VIPKIDRLIRTIRADNIEVDLSEKPISDLNVLDLISDARKSKKAYRFNKNIQFTLFSNKNNKNEIVLLFYIPNKSEFDTKITFIDSVKQRNEEIMKLIGNIESSYDISTTHYASHEAISTVSFLITTT